MRHCAKKSQSCSSTSATLPDAKHETYPPRLPNSNIQSQQRIIHTTPVEFSCQDPPGLKTFSNLNNTSQVQTGINVKSSSIINHKSNNNNNSDKLPIQTCIPSQLGSITKQRKKVHQSTVKSQSDAPQTLNQCKSNEASAPDENPSQDLPQILIKKPDAKTLLNAPKQNSNQKTISVESSPSADKICQVIIEDYLKRNGFNEIWTDLQAKKPTTKLLNPPIILENLVELNKPKLINKVCAELDQDKPYDAWTNIQEGFRELYGQLNPDDPSSEVDKVVKYILDQNIPIRYLNVTYNTITNLEKRLMKAIKQNCPDLKIKHFSQGSNSVEEKIKLNWEKLTCDANVQDANTCIRDFTFMHLEKSENTDNRLQKRNVLGCYLAQELPFPRLGLDVFFRATSIVFYNNIGPYTEEEDALILSEVQQFGANGHTWNKLKKIIRKENVRNRHSYLLEGKREIGRWTTGQYEMFFKGLFSSGIPDLASAQEFIESRTRKDILKVAKFVTDRTYHQVCLKWFSIKQILLSYHKGSLHKDWSQDIFQYIVEKKIGHIKYIDWEEAKVRFPLHTATSLCNALRSVRKLSNYAGQPLYRSVEDYLKKSKHQTQRRDVFEIRDKIVHLYDKARGITKY